MKLTRAIINSKFIERLKRQLAIKSGIYFRLKRINPTVSEFLRIAKLLNHYNITKVLDVGANTGQFAESLIDFGYKGAIVSFEPIDTVRKQLKKRTDSYENWSIADKMAIGNHDGEIEINVSDETVFSSIKTIKPEYVKQVSAAKTTRKEQVPIAKLDSLKDRYYSDSDVLFLKIDTQGFEKEVLEGATELLKQLKGVMVEIPLVSDKEIYEDVNWDIQDYFRFFNERGFKLVSIEPVTVDSETGFVNEADCVFIRN